MKRALAVAAALFLAACGGSKSPTTPTADPLAAVGSFVNSLQQISMSANTVTFTWASTGATSYKMMIGTASGGSNLLNADVTGTSYTWTGPRTAGIVYARVAPTSAGQTGAASTELPVFLLDMRNMIDALFFATGPMSQNSTFNPTPFNSVLTALIWAEGSALTVLVTAEAGPVSLSNAQKFTADYVAAMGNYVSATVSVTNDTYKGVALSSLPPFTIVVRVDQVCTGVGVIACANFGPLPSSSNNRSFVNLNAVGGATSVAHEIGHSFGLSHMAVSAGARPEFAFLLNPALVGQQLTEAEKAVLSAARNGGMRANWTRAQALAQDLVLPYTGGVVEPPAMLIPAAKDILNSLFPRRE
jgi:hypothetical protein